jgi:hypothetical protein
MVFFVVIRPVARLDWMIDLMLGDADGLSFGDGPYDSEKGAFFHCHVGYAGDVIWALSAQALDRKPCSVQFLFLHDSFYGRPRGPHALHGELTQTGGRLQGHVGNWGSCRAGHRLGLAAGHSGHPVFSNMRGR